MRAVHGGETVGRPKRTRELSNLSDVLKEDENLRANQAIDTNKKKRPRSTLELVEKFNRQVPSKTVTSNLPGEELRSSKQKQIAVVIDQIEYPNGANQQIHNCSDALIQKSHEALKLSSHKTSNPQYPGCIKYLPRRLQKEKMQLECWPKTQVHSTLLV